jgi:hypothetical protein
MRDVLTVLGLVITIGGAEARQQLPSVPELLTAELKASEACETAGDPAVTHDQRRLHDRLSGRLAQAGYCYGRRGKPTGRKSGTPVSRTRSTRMTSRQCSADANRKARRGWTRRASRIRIVRGDWPVSLTGCRSRVNGKAPRG